LEKISCKMLFIDPKSIGRVSCTCKKIYKLFKGVILYKKIQILTNYFPICFKILSIFLF